jgi:VWFA-related protein
MPLRVALLWVVAFASSAFIAHGQNPPPAPSIDIRVDTTLVVIPVTVTDTSNRFVLGLEKSDFTLLEDGVQQKISQFAGENAPISLGLLVDLSGSMGAKIRISREAVKQILKTLDRQDETCLIEFSDRVDVVANFSDESGTIEDKLENAEPGGLTALLDAVSVGLGEMKKAKNARKALVIISDGGDNNSKFSAEAVKDLVRQADVQVYSLGVFERGLGLGLSMAEVSGPKLLTSLSEQTGGRVFAATHFSDLPTIAGRIGVELRNQYVVAYAPTNHKKDGKYRKVEVKVKPPAGLPDLKARWRAGYYAPSQ